MKSISSLIKWILFIPVCMLSVIVALFEGINPGSVSNFFATNSNGLAGIIAFSVLGLFVACFVISLFDRKTSPVHILRKNPVCGVLAVFFVCSAMAFASPDAIAILINSNKCALDM